MYFPLQVGCTWALLLDTNGVSLAQMFADVSLIEEVIDMHSVHQQIIG